MTLTVLLMRPFEPSLRCPALPAREPSPAIFAASTASGRGGAAARTSARHLRPPGAPLYPARGKERCAGEHPGGKGGVYREVALQFDPPSAPDGTTTRRRDQCVGCRSVAAGSVRRFRPWVTRRPSRDSTCGCKPSEIVWRRKKWPTLTACWCRRCGFLQMN